MHFEALRWLWLHGHHVRHGLHLRGMHIGRHHHALRHGARWIHKWTTRNSGR